MTVEEFDNAIQKSLDKVFEKILEQIFKDEVGCEIRHYRGVRAMTQRDLSRATQIDQGYISKLENGRATIDIFKLISICDALKVNLCMVVKSKQFYLERQDEIHNARRQKWN